MTPDMQLALPARAENIAIVRHALGAFGEVLALDSQTLSDIRLAVTEACTNVVVHAYPEREGPLEVLATLDDEQLTVIVRDEGQGITPRPDSPGLGLGLPLIASLAESMALRRDDYDRTEVQMNFALGPENLYELRSRLTGRQSGTQPPNSTPLPSTNGGTSSEDAPIPPISP